MITTSPEKSRDLKAAGWDQKNAHFDWCINGGSKDVGKEVIRCRTMVGRPVKDCIDPIAAPTAEEILRELPVIVRRRMKSIRRKTREYDFILKIQPRTDGTLKIKYTSTDYGNASSTISSLMPFSSTEKLLANAAASMYCYLKESNLL